MDRRHFLVSGAAGLAAGSTVAATAEHRTPSASALRGQPFRTRFAPHFGMFRNHAESLEDQLQFAFDEGFRAWEDNGMPRRNRATQDKLAAKMQQLGITMGVFVAHADFGKPTFAAGTKKFEKRVLADIEKACELSQRVNAKWCTVVPGTVDHRQDLGYQRSNVVDLLKRCCDLIDSRGIDLCMVLEPLNFRDHPNLFVTKIADAFDLCRNVGSPHCKILNDLYHQQITEGNLIPNIDRAWAEIPYYQVGDNPGRKEPGTGEIHYKNVFAHLWKKGFRGVVGMEHGNAHPGKDGERRLIEAYRAVDVADD
ncbi:MAG: TIM barrel protein [bacterium]|nr:TIM barrel protein [bacterium]